MICKLRQESPGGKLVYKNTSYIQIIHFCRLEKNSGKHLNEGYCWAKEEPKSPQMSPDKDKVINESYAINECDLLLY